MRAIRLLPFGLLAGGIALLALVVYEGAATVSIFVVVPVVTSSSPWLLLGALLLVSGLWTLPFAWWDDDREFDPEPPRPTRSTNQRAAGGLVLIGPVPIFLGGWRQPRATVYWLAVALGSVALVLGLLVLFRPLS